MLPGNIGLGIPSFSSRLTLLKLASTSQKGAYIFIWRFLQISLRGHIQIPCFKKVSRVCNCGPTELYIFAYLKSCCLKVHTYSNEPETGLPEVSPFGTPTDLSRFSTTGTYQEKCQSETKC